jgi:hypothetical protein
LFDKRKENKEMQGREERSRETLLDQLKSKHCVGHKRFGNSNHNALEKDETKKSRRFIEERFG